MAARRSALARVLRVVLVLAALALVAWIVWLVEGWIVAHGGFGGGAPAAELKLPPAGGGGILVVAPHPDDEVLGCGGVMQHAVAEGVEITVALMTNGDASELAVIFGDRQLPLSPEAYRRLGERRQGETLQAVGSLGVPADHVRFLGYPNGGLTAMWRPEHWLPDMLYTSPRTGLDSCRYSNCFTPGASYCGHQVLSDLISLLEQVQPRMIFVTHLQDIHPDHWTTAAFTMMALETLRERGEPWARQAQVYGYLIHWPHWPVPHSFAPRDPLVPPADLVQVSGEGWERLKLSGAEVQSKVAALHQYRSQKPSWDRLVLSFARATESFQRLHPPVLDIDRLAEWPDEPGPRRRMQGADVKDVTILPDRPGVVEAEVLAQLLPLTPRGYIAVDLRARDAHGEWTIATARILDGGRAELAQVSGGRLVRRSLAAEHPNPGLWRLDAVPVPGGPAAGPVLVACWGSIADLMTDPAFPQ